jgi:hypothetical protein
MTKPETLGAGVVPGDQVTAEASSSAGVMRFEVPCSPRPAVRGMPATTPVPLERGREMWPEIQTHQAMIAAVRSSERMSVGGLVTAASQRAGTGECDQVVSGETCAARSSGSEASAESANGTKATDRLATMLADATLPIAALRAMRHHL